MAFHARISVKGAKQGQFKGESLSRDSKDFWIPVGAFTMGLKSPRDVASGLATGKVQFAPITITKNWGPASPQGLSACATNETLTTVVAEFVRTNATGEEFVSQRVTLTDAAISEVRRLAGNPGDTEEWSLVFRKIKVEDKDGDTAFIAEWPGHA